MHPELHKKTYFQALEKLLASPTALKDPVTKAGVYDTQTQVFEDTFKRPPSNFAQRATKKRQNRNGQQQIDLDSIGTEGNGDQDHNVSWFDELV